PQRAHRGRLAGQYDGPAGLTGQDPPLLPFAGLIRVMSRQHVVQPGRPPRASGSHATRTGTSRVSSLASTDAGTWPRLTGGRSVPPATAIRSRISRASVGVAACVSSTVPARSASASARSKPPLTTETQNARPNQQARKPAAPHKPNGSPRSAPPDPQPSSRKHPPAAAPPRPRSPGAAWSSYAPPPTRSS